MRHQRTFSTLPIHHRLAAWIIQIPLGLFLIYAIGSCQRIHAADADTVLVATNSAALVSPTAEDFFADNIAGLTNALRDSGWSSGAGGTLTNVTIGVNSGNVSSPILTNSSRITVSANGSIIFYDLVAGSIGTNYWASTVFDWLAATFQGLDADLTDLADGSLTGSKVGSGISGDNVTTGTVAAARIDSTMATDAEVSAAVAGLQAADADLTDLADGSLTGSKVGSGISGDNITTGTVADARIPTTIARTNAPTLHNATFRGTNTFEAAIFGTGVISNMTGNASGLTNLNASELSSGTVPTNRLDSNTAQLAVAGSTGTGTFMRTRTGVARTIWIPANAMSPMGTAPTPATNTWATTTDGQNVECWDFSATVTNSLTWTLALNSWDAGTVKFKVHYKQVGTEATSTNVWSIGGGSLNAGDAGGNTLGTMVNMAHASQNGSNILNVTSASSAVTIGGSPGLGHFLWFVISRLPGHANDNATVAARLIGVDMQYTESSTEPTAW